MQRIMDDLEPSAPNDDQKSAEKSSDIEEEKETQKSTRVKEKTPGVIYLSSIPEGMQYNDVYRVFSELGDVGRISLQTGGTVHTRSL